MRQHFTAAPFTSHPLPRAPPGAGTTAEAAVAEGRVDAYALARLRADLEMQLSSLKNAAYAAGHVAGKGEVVAHAERRYA